MDNDILAGLDESAIRGLAETAKGLLDDQSTRHNFLGMVKQKNARLSIPEIDIPAAINAQLAEERAKREALEAKIRENDVRAEIEKKRMAIRSKGIAESEVAEVEKLMVERSIGDHNTAAEFFLAQKRMATPTPPSGKSYESLTLPKIDASKYNGNMRNWGKNVAAETFAAIRNGEVVV